MFSICYEISLTVNIFKIAREFDCDPRTVKNILIGMKNQRLETENQ